MGEKHERKIRSLSLDFSSQRKYLLVGDVIHTHHHIDTDHSVKEFPCFCRSLHPYEFRWITQVKINVFPVNLSFDLSVFFENERVIMTADHEDLSDSIAYQGFVIGFVKFLKQNWFQYIHIYL